MNKLQEFAEQAKKAEEEFAALHQTEEPSTPEEAPTESTPEPTAVQPEPEAKPEVTQEEKYKAAVKAMNEAQRKAAEATKEREEFLKRQQEMEAKLNEALEQLSKRPEPEAQDDLETDMPEVARLAELKAKRVLSPLEQKMSQIETQLKALEEMRKQQETELNAKSMLTEIRNAHPDYDDVVNSDEMVAWINNEAPPVYKAIFDGAIKFTAKDAIAVLNAYKSTTTPTPAQKPTPSAAEIAAPIKTNTLIASKPQTSKPITAKELDWFMHNSHKLNATELAEWDARLSST